MQNVPVGHRFTRYGQTYVVRPGLRYVPEAQAADASRRGWTLQNSDLKALLGWTPKLPRDAVAPVMVGNVSVYVLSAAEAAARKPKNNRPHRVTAVCPGCAAHVPAGRIGQHKCKA
ncbi:hypothetical protein HOT99_gp087 [Caulobacter phage CcrBL10]|uniref:Uncharacterized protein n=1 Tax=Caulobacter phage CcrBL10 TaxID=2283269 RepID=A0A385EBG8_9CAUD|nr:hypothetical protein HOT99_gp008 [Caulobacter phage CcrBL10]YP_009809160.1 hypothetical protein HOT99_gp087 [Caulobacter phage CcrBL10]AXQ68212.1 hypothetical protein CcrBL10_gp008 [Caulobacter phage CcrBL10]AXQ68530.1 hypothetical protein CcrBL10_gp326 [Caulobacter phage CcrBL10]